MKYAPILTAIGFVAAAFAVSGPPAPKPAEAAPVVIDHSAELTALKAELESLRAELAQAHALRGTVTQNPVAVAGEVAAAGRVTRPVAYYQRRAVYGPLGRIRGYENVLVSGQQVVSQGNCANGNCSTGLFGRRR